MILLQKAADFAGAVFDGLARRVNRFGTYAFLDAKQAELGGVARLELEGVVLAYARAKPDFTFVQIGAHEGKSGDPLQNCVRALGLRGVLVEPQPGNFAALKANYADQPQLSFEQAVIADSDGTMRFYRVDPGFWKQHGLNPGSDSEISSLRPEQIRFHVKLFGGAALAEREEDYLRWDDLPALTVPSLLAKHNMPAPDLIQIDAEGFDYEILKTIDWTSPPPLVHFETVHLSVADRVAAWDLLRGKGYRLFATDSYNTLAIHTAPNSAAKMN